MGLCIMSGLETERQCSVCVARFKRTWCACLESYSSWENVNKRSGRWHWCTNVTNACLGTAWKGSQKACNPNPFCSGSRIGGYRACVTCAVGESLFLLAVSQPWQPGGSIGSDCVTLRPCASASDNTNVLLLYGLLRVPRFCHTLYHHHLQNRQTTWAQHVRQHGPCRLVYLEN